MPVTASSSVMSCPSVHVLGVLGVLGQALEGAQGVPSGAYVVHPQAPHAELGEVDRERGVRVLSLVDRADGAAPVGEEPTEEGFPAGTHQYRVPELEHRTEVAQQGPVVLGPLGEAE